MAHLNITVTIPVDEILSVSKITGKKSDGCEVIGFTISCIRHMKKSILKREMVQFLCDSEEGTKWSEKIQLAIEQGMFLIIRIQNIWISDKKNAEIILKFEQCGCTIQYFVQKMQTEWQIV